MKMQDRAEFKIAWDAIDNIKGILPDDVFKDQCITSILNRETMDEVGFTVVFQLNMAYDYDDSLLNGWGKEIGSDYWYINSQRNRLYVNYVVYYSSTQD